MRRSRPPVREGLAEFVKKIRHVDGGSQSRKEEAERRVHRDELKVGRATTSTSYLETDSAGERRRAQRPQQKRKPGKAIKWQAQREKGRVHAKSSGTKDRGERVVCSDRRQQKGQDREEQRP